MRIIRLASPSATGWRTCRSSRLCTCSVTCQAGRLACGESETHPAERGDQPDIGVRGGRLTPQPEHPARVRQQHLHRRRARPRLLPKPRGLGPLEKQSRGGDEADPRACPPCASSTSNTTPHRRRSTTVVGWSRVCRLTYLDDTPVETAERVGWWRGRRRVFDAERTRGASSSRTGEAKARRDGWRSNAPRAAPPRTSAGRQRQAGAQRGGDGGQPGRSLDDGWEKA